jgi:hypothetical protein
VKLPAHLLKQPGVAVRVWAALLGLLLSGPGSLAQLPSLRWHWSNPLPHGGNVVDMAYSPARLLAVQVAERGQIYTSDNLDLWLPRASGTTNALRAVTFLGSRIVITGENGCVLYSDNGESFKAGKLSTGLTSDWLEAATASPSLAVTVGDYGAVYASADGIAWARQTTSFTAWLRGVAYGGGAFVAVGEGGFAATSANGTNWTTRNSGVTNDLNRVQYSSGRFTALGAAGRCLYSTNAGVTWYSDPSGATGDLENTALAGADRLVVGFHEVRLKTGGSWSNQLASPAAPPDWSYYAAIGQPGYLLIAGQTGMLAEGFQTNGAPFSWLAASDSARPWLWDSMYVSGAFFYTAVGDYGTVMTSDDGVAWNLEAMPAAATNTTFMGVGGATNLLLAVGDTGAIYYSPAYTAVVTNSGVGVVTQMVYTLGVVWRAVSPRPTTNDLQGVAVLSNSLYVVTGDQGVILTSATGTNNWVRRSSLTSKLLSSVTDWPGGLVATGDDGAIVSSANGIAWTIRAAGLTTNWLYRVRYLGGSLIAVGQNGAIFTSTNAINWTARASGTTKWLTDATRVSNYWFVVGYGGTVLASTNLANWSSLGALTKKHLYSVATDSNQLVTVGIEGVILRTQVVPDLTPIAILDFDRVRGSNAIFNIYLFGGKADQRFTLDRLPGLSTTNWTTGPQLEFLDSSGTLYYLETLGSNSPPQEYYRALLKP